MLWLWFEFDNERDFPGSMEPKKLGLKGTIRK